MSMNQAAWDEIWDPIVPLVQLIIQLRSQRVVQGTTDYITRLGTFETTIAALETGAAQADLKGAVTEGGYRSAALSHRAIEGNLINVIRTRWLPLVKARLQDDADVKPGLSATDAQIVDYLLINMGIVTAQSVDAATPTLSGTVAYNAGSAAGAEGNQGDGVITIVVNTDAQIREQLHGGNVRLRNVNGQYGNQLVSTWALEVLEGDPDDLTIWQSPNQFATGKVTHDVIRNAAGRQFLLPPPGTFDQKGRRTLSRTTGLIIDIQTPAVNDFTETGDAQAALSNWKFDVINSGLSPFNRWNTTYAHVAGAAGAGAGNGTIYIRFTDLVGSWSVVAYKDAGLTIPLSEARTFTEGSGDQTNWALTVASTHPSAALSTAAIPDPIPFLTAGSSQLLSFNIDDSSLTLNGASFTSTLNVNLPWAEGDVAMEVATRSAAAGLIGAIVHEALGVSIRSNAAGAETVPDPAA